MAGLGIGDHLRRTRGGQQIGLAAQRRGAPGDEEVGALLAQIHQVWQVRQRLRQRQHLPEKFPGSEHGAALPDQRRRGVEPGDQRQPLRHVERLQYRPPLTSITCRVM